MATRIEDQCRKRSKPPFDTDDLITAVETVIGLSREDLYGSGKSAKAVMAKEVLILAGHEAGVSFPELSRLTGLNVSTVSRRYEAAQRKARADKKLAYAKSLVVKKYGESIARLHA